MILQARRGHDAWASIIDKAAVVDGERRSAPERSDRGELQTAEDGVEHRVRAELKELRLVDAANRQAMANVKVGVAIVQTRIERIEIAEIEVVAALGGGRAQVIQSMGVGVVDRHLQAKALQIVRVQADVYCVIVRVAIRLAHVDRAILVIETVQAIAGRGIEPRVAVEGAIPYSIHVSDGVLVDATSAGVLNRE